MAASSCAVRNMSQKPDSVVRHLTQDQLADRWQISPRTLERWRWLGEGPRFLKLGGRVVYRLEDIEALRGRAAARQHHGPGSHAARLGPVSCRAF